jgi:putative DNA primase/helicase
MFALNPALDLTGIDLDSVIRDGDLLPEAQRWVHLFDSFTERSPSGSGLHILVTPGWFGTRNRVSSVIDLEVYGTQRFFTATGMRLTSVSSRIEHRPGELLLLENRFLSPPTTVASLPPLKTVDVPVSDATLLERAYASKGGDRLQALMRGDLVSAGFVRADGTPDHSAADLALCGRLYFWTGGNLERTESLFRRSGLYRPKWDSRRGDSGTYGSMTLDLVQRSAREVYRGLAR